VALAVIGALLVFCRKRRKRTSIQELPGRWEKAEPTQHAPMRRHELEGSEGLVTSCPVSKPERSEPTITEVSTQLAGAPQKSELLPQIPRSTSTAQSEKQVLECERSPPYLPEPLAGTTSTKILSQKSQPPPATETAQWLDETFPENIIHLPTLIPPGGPQQSYNPGAAASALGSRSATTDINVMKAQERELAERLAASESLQRLRAEHAALQDRIRLAKLKAQELNRS